jgi:hypothetical protein
MMLVASAGCGFPPLDVIRTNMGTSLHHADIASLPFAQLSDSGVDYAQ